MTTINVYLSFDGNCKAAFDFYREVFGGEFSYIGTYEEMPEMPGAPPMNEELKGKIMHMSLPISGETMLMGSDAGGEWAKVIQKGNNVSISINTKDKIEAERIFTRLALNGQITMPFEKTFWQAYYGMLIDQFGIYWMVNCEMEEHQKFEEDNKQQGI